MRDIYANNKHLHKLSEELISLGEEPEIVPGSDKILAVREAFLLLQ